MPHIAVAHHVTAVVGAPTPKLPGFAWPLLFFILGFVLGCIIANVVRQPRLKIATLAAIVAAGLGVVGAIGHVLFSTSGTVWMPVFDTTTLLWVVVAAVGFALPIISEITVGGVNLKLHQAQGVTLRATHLMQTWAFTTSDLLAEFEDPELNSGEAIESILKFLKLRAYEALEWIGQDGEERRLAIWMSNATIQRLEFFFSNEIRDAETTSITFGIGDGIVGTVFENQETWNERDAPSIPIWRRIRNEKPRYHGLFCTPINFGEYNIGVLSVDRQKEERFQEDHVDVLTAFAEMVGTVLGNEKARAFLAGLE